LAVGLILAGMVFLAVSDFSFLFLSILLVVSLLMITMAYFWRRLITWSAPKVVVYSLVAIIGANAMLNLGFYPELLEYQSGGVAGREVKDSGTDEKSSCFFVLHSPSFDFYFQMIVPFYRTLPQLDSALAKNESLKVFTNEQGLDMLREHGYFIGSVKAYKEFKATKLSLLYLFNASRDKVVSSNFVAEVGQRSAKVRSEE
jgi:hypothetical protein